MTSDERPRPSAADGPVQLHLQFPHLDPAERPLIETGPYAPVLALLRRWQSWPGRQLALIGEAGAGKTRLLTLWAAQAGAAMISGEALARADIDAIANLSVAALAVDDAFRGEDGRGLLTALNMAQARGAPVLLAGVGEPAVWFSSPPDLRSRLQAMTVAGIGPPDDDALLQRLKEACAQRHLNLPDAPAAYLAERMPRSWGAIQQVADQIEQTRGRAFTLPSARRVLEQLGLDPG